MKILLLSIAIIVFSIGMIKATHYQERMKEYNYHMCVEVYGLDEHCNPKK